MSDKMSDKMCEVKKQKMHWKETEQEVILVKSKKHYQKGNPNMNKTDLTFITNGEQQNLKARFRVLIKDTKLFDCLVGYFYTSGFHAVYKSLENTEKIRILIGISTKID